MRIKSLRISNVMSFPYQEDIAAAEPLTFNDGLNIIIGENGSGKSTALEVVNFLFKRIICRQIYFNRDLFIQRETTAASNRKQILNSPHDANHRAFRLAPNWDTPIKPQTIQIELQLDDVDKENIELLRSHYQDIFAAISPFTNKQAAALGSCQDFYKINVTLDQANGTFAFAPEGGATDFGYEYLTEYNFYRESIALHNYFHPDRIIPPLAEPFTLIGSFRNYHQFNEVASLSAQDAPTQMHAISQAGFSRSLNATEQAEPVIFSIVKLRVAATHFDLFSTKKDAAECEEEANRLPFIININKRLKVVNLKCNISLEDQRTWRYNFKFTDTRTGRTLSDVNSLSAGQKAIVHLVLEAYGRGNLKGGLVLIDEPEIHLHYQFQHEYLQVIEELNKEQRCQYILVTHSEALINSSTISQVKRFSLNQVGHTAFKAPTLSTAQKTLIKILDNTRSTYAFFAKKVVLVEGDSDRYFFKAVMQNLYPQQGQDIALLYVGGKGNFDHWTELFEAFGLTVYRIADFDFVAQRFYPLERAVSMKLPAEVATVKARNPDWEGRIEAEYANRTFILKSGRLEHYLGTSKKDLDEVIKFCSISLGTFLENNQNALSVEVRDIIKRICE